MTPGVEISNLTKEEVLEIEKHPSFDDARKKTNEYLDKVRNYWG